MTPEDPLQVIDEVSNRLSMLLDTWNMDIEAEKSIRGEIDYLQRTLAAHNYISEQEKQLTNT